MKKIMSFLGAVLFALTTAFAQQHLPGDYLKGDFHKERRTALREMLPANSVAVVFANPVRNRANDVDFIYHQDPDFYYLTGYNEPNSVLLIFSENQTDTDGNLYDEKIFVQARDQFREMWNGRRLGVEGVQEKLGFEQVAVNADFLTETIDFASFYKIFFVNVHEDVRNTSDTADLHDLIAHFKKQVKLDEDQAELKLKLYDLIRTTSSENSANVATVVDRVLVNYPELKQDKLVQRYQQATSLEAKLEVVDALPEANLDASSLDYMLNSLREVKTPEELVLLKKAIEISAVGQTEVMKAMHPGMTEMEVQGIHEFVYKKYGAEYEGYPSIVGAGENGCILHYIENSKMNIEGELVLMDLGAEYHGYTADVTRTIPANGKFTKEQRAIYDLVYKAQQAGIEACKPGVPFKMPHLAAQEVINKGLKKLGIIKSVDEQHMYFPHGTSHYLGLDVHDRGNYGDFKAGMVITVEPGIYIPENSDCDPKWWGIAVRIEDDVLITDKGFEILSDFAPRKSSEIELLMAKPSALDDFKLPELRN